MLEEEKWLKLIQKANGEQTEKLAQVAADQTKLLREEIKSSINEINNKVETALSEIKTLSTKYIAIERRLRRNNIVIFGLEIKKENLLLDTIAKLNTLMNVELKVSDINHIYTTGKKEKAPIIIELISFLKKQEVFSRVTKLKGSGIFISNDLCNEDRESRKVLRDHQKKATAQNLKAKIKGNKLIVEDNSYTVEDLKALEKEVDSDSEHADHEEEESENNEEIEEEISERKQEKKDTTKGTNEQTRLNKRKRRKVTYSPRALTSGGNVNTRSTRSKKPSE